MSEVGEAKAMTTVRSRGEDCRQCGHPEEDHRSIPPYYCQHGMAEMKPLCECPYFWEENPEELDALYEAQKYEDMLEQYR